MLINWTFTSLRFNKPISIVVDADSDDTLYLTDHRNAMIRSITLSTSSTPQCVVTNLGANSPATGIYSSVRTPYGLAFDSRNRHLYFSESSFGLIKSMRLDLKAAHNISVIAGCDPSQVCHNSILDGVGTMAILGVPRGKKKTTDLIHFCNNLFQFFKFLFIVIYFYLL